MRVLVWGLLTACVGAAAGCGSCGQDPSTRSDDRVPKGIPIDREIDAGHRNDVRAQHSVIRFDAGRLP